MKFTLDQIVREYLIESFGAMQVDNRFARFYQIGVSGMRDIYSDVGRRKSFAKLDLRDNNTASLPLGYLDYYRIGICSGDQILALAENVNACPILFNTDDCGQIKVRPNKRLFTDNIDSNFFYTDQYDRFSKNGQFVGRDFGNRGGLAAFGTFQINEEEGYIYVESQNLIERDSLVIEYSTILPKGEDGNIMIHPYETEAIKAWIYWKSIERLRSYPMSEKEVARQAYGREKKKARMRLNRMSLQDVISALRKGYGAAPGI